MIKHKGFIHIVFACVNEPQLLNGETVKWNGTKDLMVSQSEKKSYAKGVTVFQWILFIEHMEGIKLASSHYSSDLTSAKNEKLM